MLTPTVQLTRVAVDEALEVPVGVPGRDVVAAVVHPVDLVVFDVASPLWLPVLASGGGSASGEHRTECDGRSEPGDGK